MPRVAPSQAWILLLVVSQGIDNQLDAFKASLFVPHKVVQMCPVASSVDSLKAFPLLSCDTLFARLKSELPTYLQLSY